MVHTYTHTQLNTDQPNFMCRLPSHCSLMKPNQNQFPATMDAAGALRKLWKPTTIMKQTPYPHLEVDFLIPFLQSAPLGEQVITHKHSCAWEEAQGCQADFTAGSQGLLIQKESILPGVRAQATTTLLMSHSQSQEA